MWVYRSVIREVHNKLEKNRRAHLKECFEMLKKQVPAAPDEKKTSNLSILHSAIRYIQVLKRKEREYEHQMEKLAREKIAYQQKLAALKKELTAQWEHIDFNTLLPESLDSDSKKINVRGIVDSERDLAMIHSDGEDISIHPVRSATLYSSTSSLSSASPLQTDITLPHHVQVVNSSAPTSLLVSPIQLLPQTTLRMIPADTQIVHSHLPNSAEGNAMLSTGLAHVLNPLVVPQPSGPLLLTSSSQLGGKIMTTPILKTIGPMPIVNQHHQYVVKPTVVVVSTSSNVPK
uniref:Max-binding protein MNT n=1 Tax=Clastoptera arizonana TaxID=38151 RepID=A0A1B6C2F8_9HEMI